MIGVVTTSYPRAPDDWAGAFVRERVRSLLAAGVPVEVVAAGNGPSEPGVARVPDDGLFYGAGAPEVLEAGGARALIAGAAFTARLARAVAERAPRWQAIESHWLVPSTLVACAVAAGRPHRAVAHGSDVAFLERSTAGAALARRLVKSGVALVFASAELRARFALLAGVTVEALRAEVEAAPFDASLFRRASAEERVALRRRLGCTGVTVVGVGRLVPVKGFDVLLRAVARLPRARRPRVVLLGEGPERPALQQRAARGSVDLQLRGAVDRATVAAWMTAADVYAQPSVRLPSGRGEGMPVAVREALAVGVPVIASALGGLVELRDPGLTLIPPGEPEALARALAPFL